ncbi:MAG: fused MFS/spermidine synthase [Verrucomicrobia bacterium]|nr:fused MFS/spermidine synthase [Verrucomicrobiota bacterium]
MTPESPPTQPAGPRFLPLLLVLFVGSGCAALIYEVVWFQLLQFVIGSSAVSLAVLLGTFMGGMCLGSLALPRLVSVSHHPLRVYAALEIGIGLAALVILFAMPAVGRLYTALAGHGVLSLLLRAVVCVACLLPPTMLMGATLPAIARWIERTPRGVAWLGFFYGGNTAGAVAGCLLAGFWLLRVHDLHVATYAAIGLNLAVAALALTISRFAPHVSEVERVAPNALASETRPAPQRASGATRATPILLTIALSGFCALGAEVIWTRLLSLLLGATVYTFSIILAVFLAGLGLGSSVGSALARDSTRPRFALGICQLLLVLAVAWAGYTMTSSLPYWPIDPAMSARPWEKFQLDLVRCAWAILPGAMLWGASFPLALAALGGTHDDPGHLVGRVYAANTLGAIAGAVASSVLLIPWLGTQHAQQIIAGVTLVGAWCALAPVRRDGLLWLALAAVATIAVAATIPRLPWKLVAYGRQIKTTDFGSDVTFLGEGMTSTVAVSATKNGVRYFHVSGKTEASSQWQDMRLQRMLGHLPALAHPEPKSVLIVGCGAGVTAGSFVPHPSIKRIVICDIEPLIPRVVATHFREENHDVLRDPRVQVVYDDARHFIATTREKFDIITSDPIHPWVKGSAVLYSQEYFELVKQRLNPGGFVTQWVPFYESDRSVVQSEIATFFSVFPHGTIWGNDEEGRGYDTVMLGQLTPLHLDVGALQQRLDRPDHARVKRSLSGPSLGSAVELLTTYAGSYADLKGWLAKAEINRDRSLRLQYLAGLHLNSAKGSEAYVEMLTYRRFPEDIFYDQSLQRQQLFLALNGGTTKN